MTATRPSDAALFDAIDRLVDEQRTACLWFLRPDFHPSTDDERARVLVAIERHGDRETFVRAATLRRWLSQRSSVASVGS